jgi:2-dehydropantoate 2-reductase
VAQAFRPTPAQVELVTSISQVLWTKFVFISAISALGGLTRVTLGAYRQVPEARAALVEAMSEVAAVARARGVDMERDIVSKTLAFIDSADPDIKPSMQRDIEAGRVSELESMIGVVVNLGRELGVPTPVMQFAYAVIEPSYLMARNAAPAQ